jgi:hypothetical protein
VLDEGTMIDEGYDDSQVYEGEGNEAVVTGL